MGMYSAICSMVDVEYLFGIFLNLSRTKRVDCAHSKFIDSNRSKVKRFQFSDIMSYDFRTDRVYIVAENRRKRFVSMQ